jgi:hypothetical protein
MIEMFEGNIEILGRFIPRILLGTSPFIAATHFGHRARLYQLDLYNQPENILKIIKKAYDLGIHGIQLIPYPPVVDAVKWAIDEGCTLNIVGTVRPDKEKEDIKLLSELGANAMLLHAVITDGCNWDDISHYLKIIKMENSVPGLVTHTPFITTRKLLNSPILDLFDVYMVPLNKIGYLMDKDVFMDKERAELRDLIKSLDKTVIANKTLAAGVLNPKDAFDYLKTVDFVDLMTVGIASETEAVETFSLLTK